MYRLNRLGIALSILTLAGLPQEARESAAAEQVPWLAGLARVDVTPQEPVRMAGYGSRDHASEGVDTPLHARCLALRSADSPQVSLLISVDTIGMPGSMTRELANAIEAKHQISREQIVFCCTHTHCGPDLVSELSNIFAEALSDAEVAAGERYKKQLADGILRSVDLAIEDLRPASLSYASGSIDFAANRRVLKDGRWAGFGVQADGPVDHAVPVLRINDPSGSLRGVVFNYACHCTTLGGEHYQINGDWSGYATTNLESQFPDAVALSTIGCGADANPEPRGSLDATKLHGRALSAEVARVIDGPMKTIDSELSPRFDYAALTFELPTEEELKGRTSSTNPQARRHAEQLLEVLREHGRLPATYPVPIQSWQFGDQLTMVFLGGEVVVDYALRLKKQLKQPDLWVTAYANDVLGYIASERMIAEGGYEYDRSGVFYGLPGPWASGTEDVLVSRVMEMLDSRGRSKPLPADEASQSFELIDGYSIELVAAEPLVRDPVNIAFDAEGQLWVVEMGDYPLGEQDGRVKRLIDHDGDGRFDESIDFLTQLSFPTGVMPWKDGVLVSAAPDVLMARDRDGDGRAEDIEKLYTGFALANPQHRINGFTYGLDHSLHLASGDNLGEITSLTSGDQINASGHDVKIWPDRGGLAATSGRTQYVRSRNDWGEWFGNDNSRPMYQFPIEDAYLQRNPAASYASANQQLFDPPVAPPVYALTSASERFNDLFAANRFTSACSSIIARSPDYAADLESKHDVALICEPVHNLVHRAVLQHAGSSYRATRSPQESNTEFLRSSDPWFRPVRALVGPDGCLYVVDMYRETIEHPEWIPESWQKQLDLYAGSDRGRIYRIRPDALESKPPTLAGMSTTELVQQLASPIGPRRDLAQQLIIERDEPAAIEQLIGVMKSDAPIVARVHALATLDVLQKLDDGLVLEALRSNDAGLLLVAIRLAEPRLSTNPDLIEALRQTAGHSDHRVVLRTALALGQTEAAEAGDILAQIASEAGDDRWLAMAVSSSAKNHAGRILDKLLPSMKESQASVSPQLVTNLLKTLQSGGVDIVGRYGDLFAEGDADLSSQLRLASSFLDALRSASADQATKAFHPIYGRALECITTADADEQERCAALRLVGIGIQSRAHDSQVLLNLLRPSAPLTVQHAAIDQLAEFADGDMVAALLQRWPSMSKSVRDHCVTRALERRQWTELLLDALEKKQIQPSDLSPAARQQMAHTGSRSMRVRAARLTRMGGSIEKRELINNYLAKMNGPSSLAQGAAVFKQHCAVCHVANDQGQAIGASLANLTDRSNQALLTAILDPNRAVDPKHLSYVVLTDDDRTLVGAIDEEAGQSLTLAHADGKRTTIRRDEIADMKNSGVSLMPDGLHTAIPFESMRDLLAYLQSMPDLKP